MVFMWSVMYKNSLIFLNNKIAYFTTPWMIPQYGTKWRDELRFALRVWSANEITGEANSGHILCGYSVDCSDNNVMHHSTNNYLARQ